METKIVPRETTRKTVTVGYIDTFTSAVVARIMEEVKGEEEKMVEEEKKKEVEKKDDEQ